MRRAKPDDVQVVISIPVGLDDWEFRSAPMDSVLAKFLRDYFATGEAFRVTKLRIERAKQA